VRFAFWITEAGDTFRICNIIALPRQEWSSECASIFR